MVTSNRAGIVWKPSVLASAVRRILALCFLVLLAGLPAAAQPGSVLIWPVNPVIEANARAAALWLQNRGNAPITLQVRVFAWAQQDGQNVYASQEEILGTPPISTIQPVERQLIRLTRMVPPPVAGEKPYRIIVDEVPTGDGPQSGGATVKFRLRYSIPLFSRAPTNTDAPAPAPSLRWRTVREGERRFLEIRNDGNRHARLVDASFVSGGKKSVVDKGLLGYVLAGSVMRWPLPADVETGGRLVASVNGIPDTGIGPQPD